MSVGEIPNWTATSMWGDLARFFEHFRPVREYKDALKMPRLLLDILSKMVGERKWKRESEQIISAVVQPLFCALQDTREMES